LYINNKKLCILFIMIYFYSLVLETVFQVLYYANAKHVYMITILHLWAYEYRREKSILYWRLYLINKLQFHLIQQNFFFIFLTVTEIHESFFLYIFRKGIQIFTCLFQFQVLKLKKYRTVCGSFKSEVFFYFSFQFLMIYFLFCQ
jgi:hypothetical protein